MNSKDRATSIKKKILLPISGVYFLLLVLFFSSIFYIENQKQHKISENLSSSIEQAFWRKVDEKAAQHALQIHIMEQNHCVQEALKAQDHLRLSSCLDSLYYVLEDTFLVSDIAIKRQTGDVFFQYGENKLDNNSRSMNRAINLNRLSYGIELSPQNQIQMVVAKSFKSLDGKEYFIEMKTQILDILDTLELANNIQIFIISEKAYLKRKYLSFDTTIFDSYNHYFLLTHGGTSPLLSQLRNFFDYQKFGQNQILTRHQFEDEYFTSGNISLLDDGGEYFGHLIFIKDNTQDVQALHKSFAQLILIIVFITLILSVLINHYLNFIELRLKQSYQAMNGEIDERRNVEQKLQEQRGFLQAIIDGIDEHIMVVNLDYQIELMNTKAKNTFNPKALGKYKKPLCFEFSHHRQEPCSGDNFPCPLNDVLNSGKPKRVIHNHPDQHGHSRFFEIIASPLFDSQGKPFAIVETGRDMTHHFSIEKELRQQKQILSHQATHDALTSLPNRVLFIDRLEQSIRNAKRNNYQIAVLFIDLDRFKEINDSLGHSYGDQVLIMVSERLRHSLRELDTIARLGGDEFTLVLENIHQQDINLIAQKLLTNLEQKMLINEHELYVTSSIGVSLFPEHGDDAESLLKNADAAMYRAKEEGKNNFHFYTKDMTQQAYDRVLIETNLRKALKGQELEVYYQPQINIQTKQLVGMEALVRWCLPNGEIVIPSHFIPLAVEMGLINQIDEWVLKQTCHNIVKWRKAGLNPGRAAVNISIKELYQKDFCQRLLTVLEDSGCQADWLELEITEDYLMKDPEKSVNILNQIRSLGFHLSIDDFGTGYSSLSYLKRLPISKLKIDRSFIMDLPQDTDDSAITRAIIDLAKNMNVEVLAEGVENIEQEAFLLEHGCYQVQGYLYAKPLTISQMQAFLIQGIKP